MGGSGRPPSPPRSHAPRGTRGAARPCDSSSDVQPFDVAAAGLPAVRGVLHRPVRASGDGLVLTHGAGGNAGAPILTDLAVTFASAGVAVLRCDLPFRQARPTGPPSLATAARDREGLRHAVRVVRGLCAGRVFLGGISYGGRQASMLAAADPGLIAALLLLSYPLHRPGQPKALRTDHFPGLRIPTLFIHGTRDPFGAIDELEAARALIPARTALLVVDGAGHGLGYGRSAGARRDLPARALQAFGELIR